jgi:foldase protein PrsA
MSWRFPSRPAIDRPMRSQCAKERQAQRSWLGRLPAAIALGFGLVLVGCSDDPASPTVVRINERSITKQAVDHWARAMARGANVGGAYNDPGQTLRQRALAFLISSAWLRGEAAEQGVSPSAEVVASALGERREANGAAEFEQSLRASGQTLEDVKLEVETRLASAAVRHHLLARVRAVTEADVHSYYRGHRQLFLIPEKRDVELVENVPSPGAARALVARIGIGPKFAKKAFHEQLQIRPGERLQPDIERVTHAIFKTPIGVASHPMRLNGHWTVFVVRRVIPARLKPLAGVRPVIVARIGARHRGDALAAFTAAYRRRWTARTNCREGYVVQGCAQYAGPSRPEPEPFPGE